MYFYFIVKAGHILPVNQIGRIFSEYVFFIVISECTFMKVAHKQ